MIGDWWRKWRRRRILQRGAIPERDWEALIQQVPAVVRYDSRTRSLLRELVILFLHDKSIEPAGGLELTEEMRRLIALQACIPILGLGLEWYAGWHSVIVYPDDFTVDDEYTDDDGVVHHSTEVRAGEAWPQGPVVLSWTHTDDDANVVIHEFAHKLDMLNGVANGMPPLHDDMERSTWTEIFSNAYADFTDRVERGAEVPFDEYAATDPAEFFAVASEAFLLSPDEVRRFYPRVYTQLCAFYGQHPWTG